MMIEKLEQRKLLSATALVTNAGMLVIQMDDSGGSVAAIETADSPTSATGSVVAIDLTSGNPIGAGSYSGITAVEILGGSGNDTIDAITQNVPLYVNGGGGNDTILVGALPVNLGDNSINPNFTGQGSIILGGEGDDNIESIGLSNSTILGGNGNDTILAGASTTQNDAGSFVGGSQMLINGGNGGDSISSGSQSLQIFGLTDSTLVGGNGSDTITDNGGSNIINGGNGPDTISLANGDVVISSNGHDTIFPAA